MNTMRAGYRQWTNQLLGQPNLPSPPLGNFIDVEVGGEHACALDTERNIQCWGNDSNGQVSEPSGQYKTISLGFETTCALTFSIKLNVLGA